jgi:DHA2 family multidrug resistance protein-like MFS transporter
MGALILVSVISGALTDRVGARPLVAAGMLALGGAVFWASTVTGSTGYPKLLGGILLLGFGVGLSLPPTSTVALNTVKQAEAGVAAGILAMSRMVGGAFGICALGTLMIDVTARKLGQLMPFLPPGAGRQMANTPPSPKAIELAPTELLEKGREAFVYSLQVTLRYGAILPIIGALLAWVLIARRQPSVEEESGGVGVGEHTQAPPMSALSAAAELEQ